MTSICTQPRPLSSSFDDYGLLEEAGRAGMAGIMLKSHYESTIARAILANIHCASCTKAYGGPVLNWPVGGLNPYAVENAMKRGCRIGGCRPGTQRTLCVPGICRRFL